MGRLVETLQEQVRPRDVVALAGLWYLSTVVYDAPTIQFVATLAGSAIAGGGTLVADAYDLRGGVRTAGLDAPTEEPPTGRDVYRQYLSRRIRRLLRDQPRSRSELREAIDADDETVDSVLGDLREQDLVAARAGVYHATAPSEPGTLARIGDLLARGARRLARPVAVEFRADARYAESEPQRSEREEPERAE